MISQYAGGFKINKKYTYLQWGLFLLLFPTMLFIPFMAATSRQLYPDLSVVPIFCSVIGFLWIMQLVEYGRQTTYIELAGDHFIVKKLGQAPKQVDYRAILAHNERLDFGRGAASNALTLYLEADYFVIKSYEFEGYELLKDRLCRYGDPVPFQKVMTLAERNRLRWMIAGLALFIGANIAFGYLAHTPATPARLMTINGQVARVSEDRPKGFLKGVMISLRSYPTFLFYVSRSDYDSRLDPLRWSITPGRPIELLIRESDYRKKLIKTEPLTFGDKYDNYKQILVFGVSQGHNVHSQTPGPVHEPTHTNPIQRTFLLGFLLLLCWAGWAYVDRHRVLRAD